MHIAMSVESQLLDNNPKNIRVILIYNSKFRYYIINKYLFTFGIFSEAFAISSSFSWMSSISLN